jgi:hypothetical protein
MASRPIHSDQPTSIRIRGPVRPPARSSSNRPWARRRPPGQRDRQVRSRPARSRWTRGRSAQGRRSQGRRSQGRRSRSRWMGSRARPSRPRRFRHRAGRPLRRPSDPRPQSTAQWSRSVRRTAVTAPMSATPALRRRQQRRPPRPPHPGTGPVGTDGRCAEPARRPVGGASAPKRAGRTPAGWARGWRDPGRRVRGRRASMSRLIGRRVATSRVPGRRVCKCRLPMSRLHGAPTAPACSISR